MTDKRKAYVLLRLNYNIFSLDEEGGHRWITEKLHSKYKVNVTPVLGSWDAVAEVKFDRPEEVDSVVTSIRQDEELKEYIDETTTYINAPNCNLQKDISKEHRMYMLAKIPKTGLDKSAMDNLNKNPDIVCATGLYGGYEGCWNFMLEVQHNDWRDLNQSCDWIGTSLKDSFIEETKLYEAYN